MLIGLAIVTSWQFTASSSAQDKTEQASNGISGLEELQQAQANETKRLARVEKNINSLLAKARENGRVRVIVHPTFDFKVVRGQVDPDATKARHRQMATARDTLVSRLQSFARSELKTYDNAPFVVFDADEYSLLMLKSQSGIEAVEEDVVFSPDLVQLTTVIGATNAWSKGYAGAGQALGENVGYRKNSP